MSESRLNECQYCRKLVSTRYRRACCEQHSPLDEAIWVEFYGPPGWLEESKCFIGYELDGFCSVKVEPNGGFVCQECFNKLVESFVKALW